MSLVEIMAFRFNSVFPLFLDFSTFFIDFLPTFHSNGHWLFLANLFSSVCAFVTLCAGGSMFFSEQLRKFWSQKRANTSSDGLFSLYRAKVRTFAASLEAAEAVRKTDKDQTIQCTMDVKNLVWSGLVLLEISTFSLNNVIIRLIKIMNRADKNWAHF